MNLLKYFILLLVITNCIYANQNNSQNKDYIGNTLSLLKDMTPKEEYEFGKKYLPSFLQDSLYDYNNPKVKYLNLIVNSLVLSSSRPYIYDGYKVLLSKNKSFNAFALPGGIIIVNDGVFKHLSNEDQLAAILSHEIGHIQEKHNLDSDKNSKINDAAKVVGALYLDKNVDNKIGKNLAFGALGGITNNITNGYEVEHEAEADLLGVTLMAKAGYDPEEFINVLEQLKKLKNNYGGANYPDDRVSILEKVIPTLQYNKDIVLKNKNIRIKRFKKYRK